MNAMPAAATCQAITRTALDETARQRFIGYVDARPQTLKAYAQGIKNLYAYLQETGTANPQREDILAYRNHLKDTYAPATVSLYLTACRLFFAWTEQEGIYPNIAQRVKGAKLDRSHRKGYFTSQAMHHIIETAETDSEAGKRDYAIIALMATGGLRCIEVTRANIEDLATMGDSVILYVQGKGRDERTEFVKIPAETEKAIREYLATRTDTEPTAPLFAATGNRNQGGRLTTRSVSRICKSHFIQAGYNDRRLTAHSLRHTAATLAILSGATLLETQEHLRHASPTTTMIYINETNRAANTSAQRIAAAIF